ncbi:hypothetical protein EAG18_12645 [Pseudoalteromonas sp. J010]|uniref:TFIIB-type zinc ribbon-containing protein n=1 Tax=Pseudoalteromonas sp. J010 TaxID=998465 RepID=UPI000F6513FD|nr:zf-TFIIB domain-containing protein [Pseudoalteromonas sp. J010]RRS08306.1 hypothetical protein EAG18_12645 [Pseudoalteromonas sp. J010]
MNCLCDKTLKLIYTDIEGYCGYQCPSCDAVWLPRKFVEAIKHTYHFTYAGFLATRTPLKQNAVQSCPDDGHKLVAYQLNNASFSECPCCASIWFEAGELQALLQNYQRVNSNTSILDKLDIFNLFNILS